jgi:hypothetical protein
MVRNGAKGMKMVRRIGLVIAVISIWSVAAAGLVQAKAPDRPAVVWAGKVIYMYDNDDDADNAAAGHTLLSEAANGRIVQAITAKLHALDKQGRLPFRLQEYGRYVNREGDFAEAEIGLVPLATLASAVDTDFYGPGGRAMHRSEIISGLMLAICGVEEDGDKITWRILGGIPLNSYDVIVRTAPITPAEKEDAYARLTVQAIQQDLDFHVVKNWSRNQIGSAYQVSEVKVSSAKAQEIFRDEPDFIKMVLANYYTSSYQKQTGRLVYPPSVGGIGWEKNVEKNLQAVHMDSGFYDFVLEPPDEAHRIRLELSGVGWTEVEKKHESDVVRDIVYKIQVKKQPGNIKPAEPYDTMREYKTGNVAVAYNKKDIITKLAIAAAQELGRQEKK